MRHTFAASDLFAQRDVVRQELADLGTLEQSVEELARQNLTITITTIDRTGLELRRRAFSGAGNPDCGIEACGSLANAEVAATQYENEQRWESARDSLGWIVDRSYS